MIARARVAPVLLALSLAAPVTAQTDTTLLVRGIEAYNNVEFDAAVGLLRRWLATATPETPSERTVRALMYIGAAEQLRGGPDSAAAAFARVLSIAPGASVDPLVFPPAIGRLFGQVRARTRVVVVEAQPVTELRAGEEWTVNVEASSPHTVAAEIRRPDGSDVRTLYRGLAGDRLVLRWDGRDAAGGTAPSGSYLLEVLSHGPSGAVERAVQLPLELDVVPADTVPHPLFPDSLLRPERRGPGPALEALGGAMLVGAALAVLPSRLAPEGNLASGRFAVAGAVSLTGIIAFLTRRPGAVIAEHRAFNETVRDEWRGRIDSLAAENAARRARAQLVIRVGPATRVDLRTP